MVYGLGVDLGTTFVAAAVAHDGDVEMFPLGDGALVTPAAVYVRDDGMLVTGDAAARRAVSSPDRVAQEIKRSLGNPTPLVLGGAPYAVTTLLGTLLQEVLGRVSEIEGDKPAGVVLTHPANWGPFRRELFEEVAQSAGLSEAVYVTEPEAAAAHYATTRRLTEGETIAVYDLGGGTFDATVLRRGRSGFEILGAPEGIERLGGADFDEAILAHVNYVSGGALSELDMSDPRTVVALARLRQDCVLAKEALSVDTETTIPVFLPNRHFEVPLTRSEFEGMIRAPIESTIGTLDRVLRTAQIDSSELAAVLLVGGSSRIPLVSRMISEEFGRPTVVGAHPKHAVALGAALLAQRQIGEDGTGAAPATPQATAAVRPATAPPEPRSEAAPLAAAGSAAASRPESAAGASLDKGSAGGPPSAPPTGPGPGTPHPPAPHPPAPHPPAWAGPPGSSGAAAPPPPAGPPGNAYGGPPPPAPRPRRSPVTGRGPVLIGVAAVLVLALVGIGFYFIVRPGAPAVEAGSGSSPTVEAPPSSAAPTPAPTSPEVATSVPIPSLGGTIPVGETPGFVVASPNGRQLYIANRTAGVVTVVDTAVDQVTATIPITAGPPQFLAFSPDQPRAYVSVWDEARTIAAVSVLDTTTNSIIATIPVDTRPFLAAVTPAGDRIYVPNHDSGTISVIDVETNEALNHFPVPANPHWIDFTPDGTRAYVANHESNLISVVDPANDTVVAEIPVERSPHSVAVNPHRPLVGNVNYDSASVTMIDTGTNTVIATIPVGANPQFITWAPDGRFAYVVNNSDDSVSVISADTFTVTARVPTGSSPTSLAVLPDGSRGYVSNLRGETLTVLNLAA